MKPPAAFAYVAPTSLDEALAAIADTERDIRPLAGGQSLIPIMNLRLAQPDVVVNLGRLAELRGIEVRPESVVVGAMTTHAEIEESAELAHALPLLPAVAGAISHPPVRNRGTIGGSVAHADPAAEWPLVLAALDARIHVAGAGGTRAVSARDFFLGYFTTALNLGELVTRIEVPRLDTATGWWFHEFARQPGAFALASVVALVGRDSVVAGIGCCAPTPVVVERERPSDLAAFAAEMVAQLDEPTSDVHASGADRLQIAGALLKDALEEAVGRTRPTR